jgi:cobalt-zinc-cadmium efflux system outer membrane protein
MKSWKSVGGAVAASLLLVGCATIPADRGESVTTTLLESRSTLAASIAIAGAGNAQTEVAKILAEPINADAAVRLALLQNPRMRGLYTELGLAQADVYDASRLSNPSLGYLRLAADGGSSRTTWSLSQSFTELLFIGFSTRVSRSQLLQTQQRVASEVLALEADVRSAYYQYVSADLVAQMRTRSATLANVASQYAQQLFDAGNISALQLSREQAQASEATIQQRRAVVEASAAQAQLMNWLGLSLRNAATSNTPSFELNLPLPVALTAELPALQDWAQVQRLDLAALRERVSMSSDNLTHVRRWRWLGGVQVDAERERESNGETLAGFGAQLELPLFNQGGGNLLRARASLEATAANLAALELEIGNDMTVRYAEVQAAQAIVDEYRQRLVPLRERIVELSQQQQTFMLIGTFELLSARQQEMDTYQSYLQAVRDYWVAYTELLRTAGGKLPAGANAEDTGISVGITPLDNSAATGDTP